MGGSNTYRESACNVGDPGFHPWGRSPRGGNGKPTPVFLPGESHGRRSLASYSPWGRKESDTTERLTLWLVITDSVWDLYLSLSGCES